MSTLDVRPAAANPILCVARVSLVLVAVAGCHGYDAGLIAEGGRGSETAHSAISGNDRAGDAPLSGMSAPDASVHSAWMSELGDAAADADLPDVVAPDAASNDDDISSVGVAALCGNGSVDPEELCDTAIASGMPGACPVSCAAETGCMRKLLVGQKCQATCAMVEIHALSSGDGCCPAAAAANANTDADCAAKCGNGVTEPGEQCDRDAGCDADCTKPSASELACRAARGSDACALCECAHCADQIVACAASGNATADMQCDAVLDCGQAHHCTAIDCYCGSASLLSCAASPGGACIAEIQAGAGTTNALTIYQDQMTSDNVVGRAAAVGACAKATCAGECGF